MALLARLLPRQIALVTFVKVLCVKVMHRRLSLNLQCTTQAQINGCKAIGSLAGVSAPLVAHLLTHVLQSTLGRPMACLFVRNLRKESWAMLCAAVAVDLEVVMLLNMTHLALPPQNNSLRAFLGTVTCFFLLGRPSLTCRLLSAQIRICTLLVGVGYKLLQLHP